jgi:cytochrome d ubiquinol oxidase subunit II
MVTPFFLGAVAGAIASGRVPPGIASGDIFGSWLNPTSALAGVLAVEVCAYLAAVYLTADARRHHESDVAEAFRIRALIAGLVTGATALAGIAVLRSDAPRLFEGLTGRGLPLIAATAVFGMVSLALLLRRRYVAVRITAAAAVIAVLWGWAVGQYPDILIGSATVSSAAAPNETLVFLVVSLSIGSVILLPSLALLYTMFQSVPEPAPADGRRPT